MNNRYVNLHIDYSLVTHYFNDNINPDQIKAKIKDRVDNSVVIFITKS